MHVGRVSRKNADMVPLLMLQVSGGDAATAPAPAVCKLNFTFDIAPNILCKIQNKTSKTEHVAPASVSGLVTSDQ